MTNLHFYHGLIILAAMGIFIWVGCLGCSYMIRCFWCLVLHFYHDALGAFIWVGCIGMLLPWVLLYGTLLVLFLWSLELAAKLPWALLYWLVVF